MSRLAKPLLALAIAAAALFGAAAPAHAVASSSAAWSPPSCSSPAGGIRQSFFVNNQTAKYRIAAVGYTAGSEPDCGPAINSPFRAQGVWETYGVMWWFLDRTTSTAVIAVQESGLFTRTIGEIRISMTVLGFGGTAASCSVVQWVSPAPTPHCVIGTNSLGRYINIVA